MFELNLVSVIIPIYNVERYITQCVDSILMSSYKHLEIIAVDDGSTDKSGEIVKGIACRDKRVKYIYQKNTGVSGARNHGMSVARGEYLVFIDADDYIDSLYLERMVDSFTDNCVDAVFGGYKCIDGQSVLPSKQFTNMIVDRQGAINCCVDGSYELVIWNKMFRRKYCDINQFNPNYIVGEDALWLIQTIQTLERIALIDYCGYYYRTNREGSAIYNRKNSRMIESWMSKYNSWCDIYNLLNAYDCTIQKKALRACLYSARGVYVSGYILSDFDRVKGYRGDIYNLIKQYRGLCSGTEDVFFILKSVAIMKMIDFRCPLGIIKLII